MRATTASTYYIAPIPFKIFHKLNIFRKHLLKNLAQILSWKLLVN